MRVRIRLFAVLRERAGTDSLSLELSDDAVVADALSELRWLTGDLHAVLAVNRDYATGETRLHADDELALIPPVSGGSEPGGPGPGSSGPDGSGPDGSGQPRAPIVRIRSEPLSLDAAAELVKDPRAGALVTFTGVTREVPSLEYEAYAEMAQAKITQIAAAAISEHGLCAVAVEHRVGTVPLSEASVVIAVSAPHRPAAFAGARAIIDALKESVPIWKRERGEWVQGRPVG